jgi:putative membrane protein
MTDDVTRRTHLASERTYLAWWRTALAAIALAIGVGRLLPELGGGTLWPYIVVGSGWAVVGIAMSLVAASRKEEVDRALASGGDVRLPRQTSRALAAAAVVLGVATLVLVIVAP